MKHFIMSCWQIMFSSKLIKYQSGLQRALDPLFTREIRCDAAPGWAASCCRTCLAGTRRAFPCSDRSWQTRKSNITPGGVCVWGGVSSGHHVMNDGGLEPLAHQLQLVFVVFFPPAIHFARWCLVTFCPGPSISPIIDLIMFRTTVHPLLILRQTFSFFVPPAAAAAPLEWV